MIKIEKGVPMPHGGVGGYSEVGVALRSMSLGDSIVLPKAKQSNATFLARVAGIRVTTRTISDKEIRVWRIE